MDSAGCRRHILLFLDANGLVMLNQRNHILYIHSEAVVLLFKIRLIHQLGIHFIGPR